LRSPLPELLLPLLSTDTSSPEIYTLSLHDALPICPCGSLLFMVQRTDRTDRPPVLVEHQVTGFHRFDRGSDPPEDLPVELRGNRDVRCVQLDPAGRTGPEVGRDHASLPLHMASRTECGLKCCPGGKPQGKNSHNSSGCAWKGVNV